MLPHMLKRHLAKSNQFGKPEEAWSSGQSFRLWNIEAGGPGFDSSSDQVVSSLLGHRR